VKATAEGQALYGVINCHPYIYVQGVLLNLGWGFVLDLYLGRALASYLVLCHHNQQ